MDKALGVGIIVYRDKTAPPIHGCENDVHDMAEFLVEQCGFDESNIRLLTSSRATRDEILSRIKWLFRDLQKGDRALFYYSGHGVRMPLRDAAGDVYRVNEAICPTEFDWTPETAITDVEFLNIFRGIPSGVRFYWISDCCHAGGLDTAEFAFRSLRETGRVKEFTPATDIQWRLKTAAKLELEPIGFKRVARELDKELAKKASHLVFMPACTRIQKAFDADFDDRANGAFTYHLLRELKVGGSRATVSAVIDRVRTRLRGFRQTPSVDGPAALLDQPFPGLK